MRKYFHIDLAQRSVREETFSGEQVARAGRYFIAKTLNELGAAAVDPLDPDNPKARARALTRVRRLRFYPLRIRDEMIEVAFPR